MYSSCRFFSDETVCQLTYFLTDSCVRNYWSFIVSHTSESSVFEPDSYEAEVITEKPENWNYKPSGVTYTKRRRCLSRNITFQQLHVQYYLFLKGKGKAVPLEAWSGPGGSRKIRFPDVMTTAQDDDKVVSLTHRPPLPPGNAPGTHFC